MFQRADSRGAGELEISCPICEEALTSERAAGAGPDRRPAALPCGHIVCMMCSKQMRGLRTCHWCCPPERWRNPPASLDPPFPVAFALMDYIQTARTRMRQQHEEHEQILKQLLPDGTRPLFQPDEIRSAPPGQGPAPAEAAWAPEGPLGRNTFEPSAPPMPVDAEGLDVENLLAQLQATRVELDAMTQRCEHLKEQKVESERMINELLEYKASKTSHKTRSTDTYNAPPPSCCTPS